MLIRIENVVFSVAYWILANAFLGTLSNGD